MGRVGGPARRPGPAEPLRGPVRRRAPHPLRRDRRAAGLAAAVRRGDGDEDPVARLLPGRGPVPRADLVVHAGRRHGLRRGDPRQHPGRAAHRRPADLPRPSRGPHDAAGDRGRQRRDAAARAHRRLRLRPRRAVPRAVRGMGDGRGVPAVGPTDGPQRRLVRPRDAARLLHARAGPRARAGRRHLAAAARATPLADRAGRPGAARRRPAPRRLARRSRRQRGHGRRLRAGHVAARQADVARGHLRPRQPRPDVGAAVRDARPGRHRRPGPHAAHVVGPAGAPRGRARRLRVGPRRGRRAAVIRGVVVDHVARLPRRSPVRLVDVHALHRPVHHRRRAGRPGRRDPPPRPAHRRRRPRARARRGGGHRRVGDPHRPDVGLELRPGEQRRHLPAPAVPRPRAVPAAALPDLHERQPDLGLGLAAGRGLARRDPAAGVAPPRALRRARRRRRGAVLVRQPVPDA